MTFDEGNEWQETKARMNRVMNMQDESSELRQRFLRDDTSGGKPLGIDRQTKEVHLLYYERGCK
jgi:hypothetical protein